MKNRFLLLSTAAIALGGLISAGPVLAQGSGARSQAVREHTAYPDIGTTNSSNTAGTNSTSAAGTQSSNKSSAQQLVDQAAQVVPQIEADGQYAQLLKQAKGVFIMPNLVKGAFLVGGRGGEGVLLKHNSDGSWSNPAFMTLGGVSIGAQAAAAGQRH